MPAKQSALIVLLRFFGCTSLLAIYAVVQPFPWMAATHEALGLGELPDAPIVSYLARSLSLFYALVGATLLVLSTDVERYRPVLVVVTRGLVLVGVALFFVDLNAGLPPYWTWWEGPFVTALGLVMTWLVGSVPVR